MSVTLVGKLDRWLATHHGVVSRSALLTMGFTSDAIRHAIGDNRWTARFPGVYLSPAHPPTRAQQLTAICLYNPQAAIAFTTAGQEWGLRKMTGRRIHVLVPHSSSLRVPGVRVHRSRRIDRQDLARRRPDGVLLTQPARTLFDSAALLSPASLESAIEQALREKLCDFETLLRTDDRLFHPRRPGAVRFRQVLAGRPVWRGAARSDLEVRLRQAIARRGLPEPEVNSMVAVKPGEEYEADLVWRPWRVIIEVDHPFWHDGTAEARKDRRRDRRLAGAGWITGRIDEQDIDNDLGRAVDDIAGILLDRGWQPHQAA